MMTSEMTRIGEGGPKVSRAVVAYAATVGVVNNSALSSALYPSLRAAFETQFTGDVLTVSARLRDWAAGLRFHPLRPWLRGHARSAYLLRKLESSLDSRESTRHHRAVRIADLFARGAWWNGHSDAATALWHRGAGFMTGHGTHEAFVDPKIQDTLLAALAKQGTVANSDIAAKLPDELNMGTSWPRFTYQFFTQGAFGGKITGTYAYETPFVFRPVVLRFFPKTRANHAPDIQTHYYLKPDETRGFVDSELAQLEAWTKAGVPTAKILARDDNWYARERIVGPKKTHLRVGSSFYGLSQDTVTDATESWSKVPAALVRGGFMSSTQAEAFAQHNTVYNLANGMWTVLRPVRIVR